MNISSIRFLLTLHRSLSLLPSLHHFPFPSLHRLIFLTGSLKKLRVSPPLSCYKTWDVLWLSKYPLGCVQVLQVCKQNVVYMSMWVCAWMYMDVYILLLKKVELRSIENNTNTHLTHAFLIHTSTLPHSHYTELCAPLSMDTPVPTLQKGFSVLLRVAQFHEFKWLESTLSELMV